VAIKDDSVEDFLAALASKASTPGGGSAAAIMGGIAAALSSMVCNLTVGRKKFAAVEEEMTDVLARADSLRARMVYAIEEDVAAFGSVMAAYGLPKATEAEQQDRGEAIQAALRDATEAPLACARLCHEAIELAEIVAARGNPAVISDGGVAVLAAHAALRSSALNVYVNAKAIEDRVFASQKLEALEALLADAGTRAEAVYEAVRKQLT
jgi:formiminotetrahydrofolate cyclodeaminase